MTNGEDRDEVVPGRTEDGAPGASGANSDGNASEDVQHDHRRALSAVRAELTHLEETLFTGHHPVSNITTRVARAVTPVRQGPTTPHVTCTS
jgi:hypothetical protein